jgi:hypothetical protein
MNDACNIVYRCVGKGPLDVVVLYAFDCTESTPDWHRVNQVYWMVQSKLAQFPDSCLSYLYVRSGSNSYTKEKRVVGGKNILPETTLGCDKDMASGLLEAESLISLSSKNPNGIILLFSDGSINNKGDFFDKAEDYVPKVPVYTFTLGSDAYNQVRQHIYIACACVYILLLVILKDVPYVDSIIIHICCVNIILMVGSPQYCGKFPGRDVQLCPNSREARPVVAFVTAAGWHPREHHEGRREATDVEFRYLPHVRICIVATATDELIYIRCALLVINIYQLIVYI